jgi:hypothetical protein
MSLKKKSSLRPWLILLFIFTLLPFLPFFLDSTQVLIYRDLAQTDLPAKVLWLRGWLNEGQIPRWNPFSNGGYPFWADLVAAPLHPFNFLFLLFGEKNAPQALTTFVFLHYPFLAWGSYRLLRYSRISPAAAGAASLALVWQGYSLSAHNLTHILVGITAAPWFAYFWLQALHTEKAKPIFWASLFLAMPIFGGDPQFSLIFSGLAFLSALQKRNFSTLKTFVFTAALALLCSSAQLLPTLQLLGESSRVSSLADSTTWAMAPARWLDLWFPNFLGTYVDPFTFAGPEITGKNAPVFFLNSLYIGTGPLLLLAWGITSGWAARRWRNCTLLLGALFFALLSMGSWLPVDLYALASRWVPLWSGFRNPERLTFYVTFSLWLSSVFCLRALLLQLRITRSKIRSFTPAVVLTASLVASTYAFNLGMPGAGDAFRHTLLCLVLFSALFFFSHRIKSALLFYGFLCFVFVFDYSFLFSRNLAFQPSSLVKIETYPLTQQLRSSLRNRAEEIKTGAPDRFLSLQPARDVWSEEALSASGLDPLAYGEFSNWEGLSGNAGTYFGMANALGHHSLRLKNPQDVFIPLWRANQPAALRLLGVNYELSRPPGQEAPKLRELEGASKKFFLAKQSIDAGEDLTSTLARLGRENVVVAHPPSTLEPEGIGIELASRKSSEVEFTLMVREEADKNLFVWNESFYPAWRAYLNGEAVVIQKANGWAMAVALPRLKAGKHSLTFQFDDSPIRAGQALSLIWLAGLGAVYFRSRRWGSRKA